MPKEKKNIELRLMLSRLWLAAPRGGIAEPDVVKLREKVCRGVEYLTAHNLLRNVTVVESEASLHVANMLCKKHRVSSTFAERFGFVLYSDEPNFAAKLWYLRTLWKRALTHFQKK
jgi:hypothetical protein